MQLWQLTEMADAVREQAWQHTAKLAWAMLAPYSKRAIKPDQLNDYLLTKKAARLAELAVTAPKSKLPDNPTNEQIETAWQEFKAWQQQAQAE